MCHDFPSTGAMIWSFTTPKIPPYGWDEVDDVKFIWLTNNSIVSLKKNNMKNALFFLLALPLFTFAQGPKVVNGMNGGFAYAGPSQATSWTRFFCVGEEVMLTGEQKEDGVLTYFKTTAGDWISDVVLGSETIDPTSFDCATARAKADDALTRVEFNDNIPEPITLASRVASCDGLTGSRQTDCYCKLADRYEKKYMNEESNNAVNLKAYQRAFEKCLARE